MNYYCIIMYVSLLFIIIIYFINFTFTDNNELRLKEKLRSLENGIISRARGTSYTGFEINC